MGPGCGVRWTVDYHLGVVAHALMDPTFWGAMSGVCELSAVGMLCLWPYEWQMCVDMFVGGGCAQAGVFGAPGLQKQLLGWRVGRVLPGPPSPLFPSASLALSLAKTHLGPLLS